MSTNAFKCPRCGKFTKHIEIGMREGLAINAQKDKGFLKGLTLTMGALNDVSGLTKFFSTVSGKKSWKCCECGLASMRNADGSIDAFLTQDWWKSK